MKAWTCRCGRRNSRDRATCVDCEAARPEPARREPAIAAVRHCPVDGTELRQDGFCPFGDGYPLTAACRFACPVCRQTLTWTGACFTCRGTRTGGRDAWTIPGDRYVVRRGHFVLEEHGPRTVCTLAENTAALRIVQEVYEGRMQERDGREALDELFALSAEVAP